MIIDDCLLVLVHSQAEAVPPRAKKTPLLTRKSAPVVEPPVLPEVQQAAIHSIEELAMIGIIDDMPVMQAVRRSRAPATMAARPRITRPRPEKKAPLRTKEPRKRAENARPRAKKTEVAPARPVRTQVTPTVLITRLNTPDEKLKTRALELTQQEIVSEPAVAINTAVRIVMQASLDLGRPYDTNMLAATFGVSRSLIMQSLRKYYEGFTDQSVFTEKDFIGTYLWIYGILETEARATVEKAIELSSVSLPGSRSVFSIARDFVILYVSEILHKEATSVVTIMSSLKIPAEVPPAFVDMTNSFLYRARTTGRSIVKSLPEKTSIADLFTD